MTIVVDFVICEVCGGEHYRLNGERTYNGDTCACKEIDMFDRFTNRSRKVMGNARQAAMRFQHQYIGTEHILLGLIEEDSGVAASVLRKLGAGPEEIEGAVKTIIETGPTMVTMGQLPFTPRTKRMLEFSSEEAQKLRHNYIGTEHLLLGILREGEGAGAKALILLDLSPEVVRTEILECLGAGEPTPEPDHEKYERLITHEAPYSFDRYQEFTRTTAVYPSTGEQCFESAAYCTFGLTGEAGEVAEKMKKRFRLGGTGAFRPGSVVTYSKTGESETYEQFVTAIKKELGDVLWYVAGLSAELGLDLSDVAGGNVEKLYSRKKRGVLKGKGDDR